MPFFLLIHGGSNRRVLLKIGHPTFHPRCFLFYAGTPLNAFQCIHLSDVPSRLAANQPVAGTGSVLFLLSAASF
jgi:hypothetical protein